MTFEKSIDLYDYIQFNTTFHEYSNLHAIYDSSSIAHTQTNMTIFVQFLVRKDASPPQTTANKAAANRETQSKNRIVRIE
mgnify:CR=1 FL=1